MIKLFTQNLNNKFTNNILYINDEDLIVSTGQVDNILYKIHSKYNFTHYIFNVSMMNNEISQFIAEYFSRVKIILFHDKEINKPVIQEYEKFCINIVQENIENFDVRVLPNNIVNNTIFRNRSLARNSDDIIFFLDNLFDIPQNIKNLLYPQTKLKIRLYNNSLIKHPQNIGLLSEQDKSDLLNSSGYFISYNNYYEQEANACGCKILDYNNIDIKQIKTVPDNYITYKQFLLDIL